MLNTSGFIFAFKNVSQKIGRRLELFEAENFQKIRTLSLIRIVPVLIKKCILSKVVSNSVISNPNWS